MVTIAFKDATLAKLSPHLLKFIEMTKVAVVTLCTVSDHSAGAIDAVDIDRKLLRLMLLGECEDKEWNSLSLALDDSEYWSGQTAEWRRAAQGDMTESKAIVDMEAKLKEDNPHPSICACAKLLPVWFNRCRSGITGPVLSLLMDAIHRVVDKNLGQVGTPAALTFDDARQLQDDLRTLDNVLQDAPKDLVKHREALTRHREACQVFGREDQSQHPREQNPDSP